MNILGKVTWKTMWKNRTRTIVTIIGVGHVYGGHDDGYQSSEFPDPWQRV